METPRKFTSRDLIITLITIVVLVLITLVVIKPAERINQAKDASRRTDITAIAKAIQLYSQDNNKLPSLSGGIHISSNEANASDLVNITPTYLNLIPKDPDGGEYKLTLKDADTVNVSGKLSDGSPYSQDSGTVQ